jgi:hypothetical protein
MVVQVYNLSTGEVEAGKSQVGRQPGLHSENLFQKNKTRCLVVEHLPNHVQGPGFNPQP